jgi:hypothetical protein
MYAYAHTDIKEKTNVDNINSRKYSILNDEGRQTLVDKTGLEEQ